MTEFLRNRQGEFNDVLGYFRARPRRLRLILHCRRDKTMDSIRGWAWQEDSQPWFEPLSRIRRNPRLSHLFVGDFIAFLIESEITGYLNLFNLGTEGTVSVFYSESNPKFAPQILEGRTFRHSNQIREKGDSDGKANEWPERFLAIAMKNKRELLRPSDLHYEWKDQGEKDDPGPADHISHLDKTFGRNEWAWDFLEIPVLNWK